MQMAYDLTLTTHMQVVSTHYMMMLNRSQTKKVGHDLDLKISF